MCVSDLSVCLSVRVCVQAQSLCLCVFVILFVILSCLCRVQRTRGAVRNCSAAIDPFSHQQFVLRDEKITKPFLLVCAVLESHLEILVSLCTLYKISQDTPAQASELSVTFQYNLPFSQKVPFPVKPAGHAQLNDPARSVQSAKV